jgi:hypothetical protein
MSDAFCSAGKYTPDGLINLYKHYYGKDALKRPYDKPNEIREKLSKEIESYMAAHPGYKPKDDFTERHYNNYGLFSDIRHDHWRDRCLEGGCDAMYDLDKLYRHYDLHQDIQIMQFDPSRIDWISIGLDSASLVLSVVSFNSVSQSAKGVYTSYGSQLLGGTSGAYSFANGDNTGGWLSVGGFAPPPFGTLASGTSVVRDFSAGIYYIPYIPPIPR